MDTAISEREASLSHLDTGTGRFNKHGRFSLSKLSEILAEAGVQGDAAAKAERAILESYRSREETEAKAERIKSLEAEVADYRAQVEKLSNSEETEALRQKVEAYEKADAERKAKEEEEAARASFREQFEKVVGDRRFVNKRTEASIFEDAFAEHSEHPDESAEEIVGRLVEGDGIFANPQRDAAKMPVPTGTETASDDAEARQFVAQLFRAKE